MSTDLRRAIEVTDLKDDLREARRVITELRRTVQLYEDAYGPLPGVQQAKEARRERERERERAEVVETQPRLTRQMRAVLEVLGASEEPMDLRAIKNASGLTLDQTRRAARALLSAGVVRRFPQLLTYSIAEVQG